jgi:1,2-diacylglycerol 3-beta-glucosyltransferase
VSWLDIGLTVCALPALAASVYLAALAVLSCRRLSPGSPGSPGSAGEAGALHFDIVVPAHNEEGEIGETLESLFAVAYPRERFRVLVVADNCSDHTAEKAAAAGAITLIRNDPEHRGKGYALAHAFSRSLADGFAHAVIVVDADTVVSRNLLASFAARFERGAAVVQADYGVRNARSSWRTRVMTIALAAFHGVRSIARERLGLSCGLRGNGMGFAATLLREQPPGAFSIVEDLEYGLQLGYAGHRVEYVGEANVLGHMAATEGASRSQRRRWERGRQALVRQHVPHLLGEAWRRRDVVLLDLACDLMVPPLGHLVLITVVGLALCAVAGSRVAYAPFVWGASSLGILLYVLRGWALSGAGVRGLLDLLWAPVYVIWKLTLRFKDGGRQPEEWVRTTREVRL